MLNSDSERMLKSVRAELAGVDTESESFLRTAAEKLIDSVILQEYGEQFKSNPGYANLQEKLIRTVLENPASRTALNEFFELLLVTKSDAGDQQTQDDSKNEEETI